jgi:predicted DNA-binding transcriptional regulator AlpA
MNTIPTTPTIPEPGLLDVKAVAAHLSVSVRQVWKFRDAGRIPQPIRLGRSVRWRASDIEQWLADACPAVGPVKRKGGAA